MSLDYCVKMAQNLPYKRRQSRHYAVLMNKKGHIISESSNHYDCSHTQQFLYARKAGRPEAIFLHAELSCLLKDKKRQGIKMFIARVDKEGRPVYSAPCEICSLALKDFSNVESIEFTV